MNIDMAALHAIVVERGISFDDLLEDVKAAVLSAYRHTEGHQPDAQIEIDRKTGAVQVFARDWRPTGILLVIAEGIFTITDPPLKLLRRFIPTLRLGMVAMDLSFMVLFIVVLILLEVVVPRL